MTIRDSQTLVNWRTFRESALSLALAAQEQACTTRINARQQEELERIARTARALAEAFAHWEHLDPGPDMRRLSIRQLYAMREEARLYGAEV